MVSPVGAALGVAAEVEYTHPYYGRFAKVVVGVSGLEGTAMLRQETSLSPIAAVVPNDCPAG